jgi:hypothetical protein
LFTGGGQQPALEDFYFLSSHQQNLVDNGQIFGRYLANLDLQVSTIRNCVCLSLADSSGYRACEIEV